MAIKKVTLESGQIEGIYGMNPAISVFKGVPYAAPPVGELRWRPPQPVKRWEGVYKADHFSSVCWPYFNPRTGFYVKEFPHRYESQSEDSLYLNIWTSAEHADEKLPVFVFIHGGGFIEGYSYEGPFDGEGLAKQGVIVVTINYRIGVFGFLAHPQLSAESELGISGNYGLMDQIAAIKWVRQNISAFGGDPDRITIGGQSSGAQSVFALSCSTLLKGDIKGAIMESGGGMTPFNGIFTYPLREVEARTDLQKELGVSSIAEARKLSDDELARRTHRNEMFRMRTPVIDGYVLNDSYEKIAKGKQYLDINYMIGCNADENPFLPLSRDEAVSFAKVFYGDKAEEYLEYVPLDDAKTLNAFHKTQLTESEWSSCIAWCEQLAVNGSKPSYLYQFTHRLPGDDIGAFHAAELWYVFQSLSHCWRPFTGSDYDLAARISAYWANFIKNGDPNGVGLPEWSAYTADTEEAMDLCLNLGMRKFEQNPRVKLRKDYILGR